MLQDSIFFFEHLSTFADIPTPDDQHDDQDDPPKGLKHHQAPNRSDSRLLYVSYAALSLDNRKAFLADGERPYSLTTGVKDCIADRRWQRR